jgi:uncharacterized membrane protein SpoIIM required for sporulation
MELWTALNHWFSSHETLLFWVGIGSALMLAGSILALPWLVGRIPEGYFNQQQAPTAAPFQGRPLLAFSFHLLRNLLALLLILAGFLMLFLPGQGLLTLLLGIMVGHFPGKYRLEQWFIRQPGILGGLNWFRERGGHPPLQINDSV